MSDDVAFEQAIAVVGMACRFPGAADVETFWRNLRDGVESISRFSPAQLIAAGVPAEAVRDSHYVPAAGVLDDIDRFDAEFFGATPREAALLDPQQRLFLECAWEALEIAGCDSERFDGRIAVFGGVGMSSYRMRNLAGADALPNVSRLQIELSTDKDYLATRASYKLNLRGPSMTVQTACSTSLTAVQLACQSLLVQQADMALAGGGTVSVPQEEGYWYEEGSIMSPDGHCRAFDVEARGTVPGCGVGVVALKRLEDALANGDSVLAVIRAAAVNNDGAHRVGFTAPSLEGQAEVIAEAHALAGVDPRTITYVEAHGTGTPVGDPIEVRALTRAFRLATSERGFCALGSVKTNVGHLDAAAGVAGLIKAVLALRHGEIPPTLHFNRPNPACELEDSPFFVNGELRSWPVNGAPRRAGVSSFGLGGTNVHVVLEEAPPPPPAPAGRPGSLLVLSARSLPALDRATANLAEHLRAHPELELADVAHTLQVGRRQFEQRRALVCRDRDRALAALEGGDPAQRPVEGRAAAEPGVVFLLPGQGSQHARMGHQLYEHEPAYRRWLDRCSELAAPHVGLDLGAALAAPNGSPEAAELEQTRLAQPALFAVEYALAQTWSEWGVRPAAMLGHSLGEYVAACLAGVFTLEEGIELVATRGRLMQEMPPGAMLTVACPVEEVERRLPDGLAVAAVNAPRQCVVSGPAPLVAAFEQQLGESLISSRRLVTSHAFHSAMLDPMVEPFVEAVGRLDLRQPRLPFVSNVHGGWITPAEATDPAYWGRQVRQPVQFAAGVRTALADPAAVLLEVGPGIALSSLARLQGEGGKRTIVASLRHPQDAATPDREALLAALGRLWTLGVPVDWAAFAQPERRRLVPLPTYSFERQRHWVEWRPAANGAAQPLQFATSSEPVANGPEPDEHFVAPSSDLEKTVADIWRQHLGLQRPIGVNESFFALGGQSLLAVEVATALRYGLDLPISINTVFQNPSVYELARAIGEMRDAASAPAVSEEEELLARIEAMTVEEVEARLEAEDVRGGPLPVTTRVPLAPEQEDTWLRYQWTNEVGFNSGLPLQIDGPLDQPALEDALRALADRHDALRARIVVEDGRPIQRIEPRLGVTLPVVDLQDVPEAGRESAALARLVRDMDARFDPLGDRLWRASLLRLGPRRHILGISLDQLICDARGRLNVIRDLAELYQSRRDGRTPKLPELPIGYPEYVSQRRRWLDGAAAADAADAWRKEMRSLEPLPLAGDRPWGPETDFRGARLGYRLPDDLLRRLREANQREQVSRYVWMLAAFSALVARYAGRPDVGINTGVVNRLWPGSEQLVGGFTAWSMPRCRWTGDPSFRELLGVAGHASLAAYARKELPASRVGGLGWDLRTLRTPVAQLHLNMTHDSGDRLDGVEFGFEQLYLGRFAGELALACYELPDELEIVIEYRTALFDAATMERFRDDLATVLERSTSHPERPLSEVTAGLDTLAAR